MFTNKVNGVQLDDQQIVTKYSMFLSSLLESRYEWFHKDLVQSNQLDMMLIKEDDLETMIGYFRTACIKNNIAKAVVVAFSEFLTAFKAYLCKRVEKEKPLSLNDSLVQQ